MAAVSTVTPSKMLQMDLHFDRAMTVNVLGGQYM